MAITGILLGLINIAITVAILILVGYIILFTLKYFGVEVPDIVRKLYVLIVALIALYMLVALLLGAPSFRLITAKHYQPFSKESRVDPLPPYPPGPAPIIK